MDTQTTPEPPREPPPTAEVTPTRAKRTRNSLPTSKLAGYSRGTTNLRLLPDEREVRDAKLERLKSLMDAAIRVFWLSTPARKKVAEAEGLL